METPKTWDLECTRQYWRQNAQMGIHDIYDALVELITNADDRYVVLKDKGIQQEPGRIEIEVERKRKGTASTVRVRDFADGMTAEVMKRKIWRVGERVSGAEDGHAVRGAHSRGAKDVAVLGGVSFDSIAEDGQYHKCRISPQGKFTPYPSELATHKHRAEIGIPQGTGTLVTLTVNPDASPVPQHDTLRSEIRDLIPLRDILSSPDRIVVLRDLRQIREDKLTWDPMARTKRLSERLQIPGYPQAEAKLIIERAHERLKDKRPRFRNGGILIKSRHAIHEATLFASDLEHDPHAEWFVGRLTCDYIDTLQNDWRDRFEKGLEPTKDNPRAIIEATRRGLDRAHPFVQALFNEALKRLRPLVEEERTREEKSRAEIESEDTRRRLRVLEKVATQFMQKYRDEEETSRTSDDEVEDTNFRKKGYSLCPPFAQILIGHSQPFWLNISRKAFPEFSVGDSVTITCETDEISATPRICFLEQHPKQTDVLRCVWQVTGQKPTKASALRAQIGSIDADSTVEVLETARDRYAHIKDFTFSHKVYSVRTGTPKTIRILAPYPLVFSKETPCEVVCSDTAFRVSGSTKLVPRPDLGIAICGFKVTTDKPDRTVVLTATAEGKRCSAKLVSAMEPGIKIQIEDIDLKNMRYRWRTNVIEIAARHASLRRYLGPPKAFPGQEEKHFRVLLAEIVAEAVCSKILERKIALKPEDWEDADWQAYYAEYSKLMTEFLPLAHDTQVPCL